MPIGCPGTCLATDHQSDYLGSEGTMGGHGDIQELSSVSSTAFISSGLFPRRGDCHTTGEWTRVHETALSFLHEVPATMENKVVETARILGNVILLHRIDTSLDEAIQHSLR